MSDIVEPAAQHPQPIAGQHRVVAGGVDLAWQSIDPLRHGITIGAIGRVTGAVDVHLETRTSNPTDQRLARRIAAGHRGSLPVVVTTRFNASDGRFVAGLIFLILILDSMEMIAHTDRSARRRIELQRVMAGLAHRDALTQLSNRLGLQAAFTDMSQTEAHNIAAHVFDLDGFKEVNDRLLLALFARLRDSMRDREILARHGGDEFVVVQGGVRDAPSPAAMADRLHGILSRPYPIDGAGAQPIGLSIGYTAAGAGEANLASYAFKRQGGGVVTHTALEVRNRGR